MKSYSLNNQLVEILLSIWSGIEKKGENAYFIEIKACLEELKLQAFLLSVFRALHRLLNHYRVYGSIQAPKCSLERI